MSRPPSPPNVTLPRQRPSPPTPSRPPPKQSWLTTHYWQPKTASNLQWPRPTDAPVKRRPRHDGLALEFHFGQEQWSGTSAPSHSLTGPRERRLGWTPESHMGRPRKPFAWTETHPQKIEGRGRGSGTDLGWANRTLYVPGRGRRHLGYLSARCRCRHGPERASGSGDVPTVSRAFLGLLGRVSRSLASPCRRQHLDVAMTLTLGCPLPMLVKSTESGRLFLHHDLCKTTKNKQVRNAVRPTESQEWPTDKAKLKTHTPNGPHRAASVYALFSLRHGSFLGRESKRKRTSSSSSPSVCLGHTLKLQGWQVQ